MRRTPSSSFLAAAFLLAGFVAAQSAPSAPRPEWGRSVQAPVDRTIFAPLDLPTPNRVRTASGAPGPEYWQQQVDYKIDANLDPKTRTIRGRERVTYTNRSPEALDYVWVHLEQNLFRKDSIGSQIEGGLSVGGPLQATEGVKLHEVTANGKPLEYRVYDTLARVDVPEPIAAGGGTFTFEIAWEFQVPDQVFRRYGTLKVRKGIIWEIAQWFPAVAVFDDVHGWNTLPYLGGGEFYTNYGTFDVAITAPRDHIVVATGVLQNQGEVFTEEQVQRFAKARSSTETVVIRGKDEVTNSDSRPAGEGPLTWRFHAEKVRTFAWAASEAFILDAAMLGDTLIQSAYHEEVQGSWNKSTQMLRAAIGGYSKRWFPYPYPVATNVAGVEGGMEYPMIIFCSANNERRLYGVTTHEIGHNWFPMLVNTDERRSAWMDEGFNTFINGYSNEDWFGPEAQGRRRNGGLGMGNERVPIMTPADRFNGRQLNNLAYFKPAAGLTLLREHILGPERFDYAFRTYVRRWAFKSPQPADFFRTMEDAAGADLAWFWRGWFAEAATLDQAVDEVVQPRGRRPAQVTFTNNGRMVMPLHYKVTYTDDSIEEHKVPVEIWFSSNKVTQTLDAAKEVREVRVNPNGVFPDSVRGNDTWTAKPTSRPSSDR